MHLIIIIDQLININYVFCINNCFKNLSYTTWVKRSCYRIENSSLNICNKITVTKWNYTKPVIWLTIYQVKFIVLDSPYICGLSRFFTKCCIYCLLFQRIIILYITVTLVSHIYMLRQLKSQAMYCNGSIETKIWWSRWRSR